MSATESASQKGTKAGTEIRPGDLERERELSVTAISADASFSKDITKIIMKRQI